MPVITQQPVGATLAVGGATTLSVTAVGSVPLTYQWRRSGLALSGATTSSLLISNAQTYLIRVLGSALGLPSAVSDPSFLVVRDNALVGMNDNWDATMLEADATTAATTRLGLVPLVAGSKDAALVLTGNVHVGSHTVQVSSPEGPGGIVLLELHDLDASRPGGLAPVIASPPDALAVESGAPFTVRVLAYGTPPMTYQWIKDDLAIVGATAATYTVSAAAVGNVGGYKVVVGNAHGAVTSLLAGVELSNGPMGGAATQTMVGQGYLAGGSVTISNTLSYGGTPQSLGWSVVLPAGWSFASDAGISGDVKPAAGSTGMLEWAWSTVPASPVTFLYTVNVPAGDFGAKSFLATGIVRNSGSTQIIMVTPSPLTVSPVARYHSADTTLDERISLFELTRVIELYNTRNGTVRTGQYHAQGGTEDGFAPGP